MYKRLIIFTRYPEPGKVKTRLIPVLGARDAADLSRRMTEHTLARVGSFCSADDINLEIRYAGGDDESMRSWLGSGMTMRPQGEGDLGRRMRRALVDAFRDGAKQAVIIGSDCPEIDRSVIRDAFTALDRNDLVLGPARDGGYYLIGLSRDIPQLFDGIPWGSDDVLRTTKAISATRGLSLVMLGELDDVDRPEDLHIWTRVLGEGERERGPTLSVIIPTLNEEESIAAAIESARDDDTEIIVVDGGSEDATLKIARVHGANVVLAPPGRAVQMNAGARQARGHILLFLHADTLLPPAYAAQVREAMRKKDVAIGAFAFRFDGEGAILRLLEGTANFRSRRMNMPYGDQALFLRVEDFRAAHGFKDMPLMEDVEFVRRLKRRGRIAVLSTSITTSSRRYKKRGPLRTALLNQLIIIAYVLGISPQRLARWYGKRAR